MVTRGNCFIVTKILHHAHQKGVGLTQKNKSPWQKISLALAPNDVSLIFSTTTLFYIVTRVVVGVAGRETFLLQITSRAISPSCNFLKIKISQY